jgi:hypothetical protein
MEIYYKNLRKRDFGFIEKGIYANKDMELLIAGNVEFDKKINKIVMRRPTLVIGSDRLEFYEYLGRKREMYGMQSRNWLKFCLGITAVHFLIVRVPELFSRHFGDEVGIISEKLGANDESEIAMKL